jgi:hypothetical protein
VSAPEQPSPSYEELGRLAARVETLEAENAELRRRVGLNSANFIVATVEGFVRGQGQAAGGSLVSGEIEGSQARWAVGPHGLGAGAAHLLACGQTLTTLNYPRPGMVIDSE